MGNAKSGKLPKKIAGVKVPKELRKGSKPLLALVNHPLAREIAVAAVLAALAAGNEAQNAAKKVKGDADQPNDAEGRSDDRIDWVKPALAAAGAEVGRRLLTAYQQNAAGKSGKSGGPLGSGKTAKVIRIVEKLATGTRR